MRKCISFTVPLPPAHYPDSFFGINMEVQEMPAVSDALMRLVSRGELTVEGQKGRAPSMRLVNQALQLRGELEAEGFSAIRLDVESLPVRVMLVTESGVRGTPLELGHSVERVAGDDFLRVEVAGRTAR
jgi:hypothetical protein